MTKTRKPIDLASERAKRAPMQRVFMPDDSDAIVGTCIGPGQSAGEPDARVTIEAPPDGHAAWSLSPAQALEVARQLYVAAKLAAEGGG